MPNSKFRLSDMSLSKNLGPIRLTTISENVVSPVLPFDKTLLMMFNDEVLTRLFGRKI
jgi:hypothetical protein